MTLTRRIFALVRAAGGGSRLAGLFSTVKRDIAAYQSSRGQLRRP